MCSWNSWKGRWSVRSSHTTSAMAYTSQPVSKCCPRCTSAHTGHSSGMSDEHCKGKRCDSERRQRQSSAQLRSQRELKSGRGRGVGEGGEGGSLRVRPNAARDALRKRHTCIASGVRLQVVCARAAALQHPTPLRQPWSTSKSLPTWSDVDGRAAHVFRLHPRVVHVSRQP